MTRRAAKRILLVAVPFTALVVGLILSTSGGCSHVLPRPLNPVAVFQKVETRLIILGDAGAPAVPRDPVLEAARKEAARDPEHTTILFLGDNVYPRGLVREDDPYRPEMERRLEAQIAVGRDSGAARTIFTPGNHDWDAWGPGGWAAIRREGDFIAAKGAGRVELAPAGGCPGPTVRDVGTRLRLVLLDSQWWLDAYDKPAQGSSCPADTEAEVVKALEDAIVSAEGRFVVVAAHHPLATGGAHGGYFGWRDHIFPLRTSKSWLWIPMPGLGSIYPWARRSGVSDQDLGGQHNRRMREAFEGVFTKHAPLVYAAGHDHNLQVMAGKDAKYLLVSGAGYYGHVSRTVWTKDTLFAAEASGYMTLEIEADGPPRLGVTTVGADGKAHEAYSTSLQ